MSITPTKSQKPAAGTASDTQLRISKGIDDLTKGLKLWRLWLTLGWNDILQRYRRSLLGPLWLTTSMAIMVFALGIVYSELFKTPLPEFVPFLTVGLLVWGYLSSFIQESGTLFTGSESYIKQVRLPYSVYVYRSTWSKLIIFLHNFIIYLVVMLYFQIWPGLVIFLVIPGLILLTFNAMLMSLALGMISARFRDVPQLVNSLVQIVFFVTPIMWKPELLQNRSYIATFNPVYHFIEIVRAPLLGQVPSFANYAVVAIITIVGIVATGAFFARFRSRISYWV